MKKDHSTEANILRVAEEEFLEKGFAGARTVRIAERAGVTHAMLHYYFRTKKQLFDRIITEKSTLLAQSILSIFSDASLPLRERMEKGIAAHFDFLTANPLLPRFLVTEIGQIDQSFAEHVYPQVVAALRHTQEEIDFDVRHLLMDILALNVLPFLTYPVIEKTGITKKGRKAYLEAVKQENITTILKRLGL